MGWGCGGAAGSKPYMEALAFDAAVMGFSPDPMILVAGLPSLSTHFPVWELLTKVTGANKTFKKIVSTLHS